MEDEEEDLEYDTAWSASTILCNASSDGEFCY